MELIENLLQLLVTFIGALLSGIAYRKSRPTRAFRNSAAIPAGQAPDGYPSAF